MLFGARLVAELLEGDGKVVERAGVAGLLLQDGLEGGAGPLEVACFQGGLAALDVGGSWGPRRRLAGQRLDRPIARMGRGWGGPRAGKQEHG